MTSSSSNAELVLLHGWGTHAGIWAQVQDSLDIATLSLDFPGYGQLAHQVFPADIDCLARDALDRAPEAALWAGWSLGGMVALRAAMIAPERVRGLMLVCSTPKFVASSDWPVGTLIEIFESFVESLSRDYGRNLRRFLLLQAGDVKSARQLSHAIKQIIEAAPQPSVETLNNGLSLLKQLDMRGEIEALDIPISIISGQLDRICHPDASTWFAEKLGGHLIQLRCGHGPLLSHPDKLAKELSSLCDEVQV